MRRFFLRIFLLVLLAGAAWESWRVLGPAKEAPFWSRQSPESPNAKGPPLLSWFTTAPGTRTWTDRSGRTLEAIPIAADDKTLRLRVLKTQTVHNLPLERLSDGDRAFVEKWRKSIAGSDPLLAAPPDRWPSVYNGRGNAAPSPMPPESTGATQVWRSSRYELRSFGPLDPAIAVSLASICESIDGACRAVPLPMMWGRNRDSLRVILIYPSEEKYLSSGGLPATAGCFIPSTGEVLICAPALTETDFLGQAKGFSLQKRQRYDVLVHELVHQASIGITVSRFPAWVTEGLAEFFSAVQSAPGQFQFRDSHLAVRNHVVESLPYDGVVELQHYPVWSLDRLLDRDLFEWNRITARNDKHQEGWIQYTQALLMVEFFCRADSAEGRRFRSYLEAVLTGADRREAADLHLLAGRTHAELEQAMSTYWGGRGVKLKFVEKPSLANTGLRLGIGLDRDLQR
jgi:hypothetical protein